MACLFSVYVANREKDTMTDQDVVDYYSTLNYEQQRALLVKLISVNKHPPYFINFKLDASGLKKLGTVTTYCKKHGIAFKAEQVGEMKIRYRFNGMSERNAVLIGQLTL